MAETQIDRTTQAKEIQVDPNTMANIFPDYTYGQFNVSREEQKDLWDKTKDEYRESFSLSKYEEALVGLEKQKLQNKVDHVSSIVGEPVENVGFENIKDLIMVFDMARNKHFTNRKKKFLNYNPSGAYQQVEINVGKNKTEKLELFKYDKRKKGWKIANPYGRDWMEIGRVTGALLDEQMFGDIVALAPEILKKKFKVGSWVDNTLKLMKKVPAPIRVTLGNWLGLKQKKFDEWMRDYPEGEFAQAERIQDVNFGKLLFDLSDWGIAALSGGLYKGMNEISNYLIKGKRPGMVEMSEEIIRAAENLDLKPLIFAQLVTNPIVRRMYEQSGLFVSKPGVKLVEQVDSLISSLNKFGIGKNKGQLNYQELINLQEQLALDIQKHLKMMNDDFPTLKTQNIALDEAVNKWNQVVLKSQKHYTNRVIDSADGAYVNIRGFQNEFGAQMKSFLSKTVGQRSKVTGFTSDGKPIKSIVKGTGSYGDLPKEFQEIAQALNTMLKRPKGSNLEPGVISQLNSLDKNFDNLKTLFNMRDDLHKLTMDKDPNISASATELHNKLKYILDPANERINGTGNFLNELLILNSHVDGTEKVRHLAFAKEALGGAGDPDTFVKQFVHPGSTLKLQALKNMLTDGAKNATDKKAGESAFNILRKAWFNNIMKNSDDEALSKWVTNDPDGLKVLLGDNWMQKVKEMRDIMGKQDKLENGVVASFLKGTERENALNIVAKANVETPPVGLDLEFERMIKDMGGFDSSGVEMMRAHIIKEMLDKSKTQVEKGSKMLSDTLNPRLFRQEIRKLQSNPYLMKFFDDGMKRPEGKLPPLIEALQNYNLYTTALAGQSDVGGMIAAGALANKTTDSIFRPKQMLNIGFTLLKHEIIARLLSKKATSSFLKQLDVDNAISSNNLALINISLAELAKEVLGSKFIDSGKDFGILKEFKPGEINIEDYDPVSKMGGAVDVTPRKTSAVNIPPEISRANQESRLARANPVGMIGTPTGGGIDPNLMARGQINQTTKDRGREVFGPFDPVFASKGGIMSTNKAFQRVA